MKLLIDMNLSPDWVETLTRQGFEALHWITVGDARASDRDILEWARAHSYVVFTHDLDFGAILAVTQAQGPSVIQVRTHDVMPNSLGDKLVQILRQYAAQLEGGALITVDESKSRVHILPIQIQI